MSFSSPFLLLLVPIILIFWYLFFREKIGYIAPNPLIAKHLKTPKQIFFLWILRSALIISIIGIIAWPYSEHLEKITEKKSSHILILLDISRSMLAEDMSPNRLIAAKKTIETFIEERRDDMIGLVIFAGKPFLSLPFSSDYPGIISFLRNITPDFIHQEKEWLSGTDIGDTLLLGNMTLSGISEQRFIVLVTDGRANIGIDPRIALEETIEQHIPVYTIGIGGAAWGDLFYTDSTSHQRVYFYDGSGNILKNDIDEALLGEIAGKAGGRYFRAGNTDELSKSLDSIKQITNIPESIRIENRTVRYELVFFLVSLIFLALETSYKRYIWRKYRLL